MRRAWPLLVVVAINALLLVIGEVGFGGSRARTATTRLSVGLVFDVGGIGDKSFNDAAHRGLMRAAEELDVDVRYVEPGDGSDREAAIRELAAGGTDLVIGVGFIFTDDMRAAARRFPEVKFACVDYSVVPGVEPPPANLAALRFREEQGSFLVGALAALLSKGKLIGFVGGMDIPLIRKFEAGYRAGVREVCPDCQVLAAYAGTEPKAFADPTTGKELALAQYSRGVEIIFHASGKTGIGVFNAAAERGRLAIGVDSDQFHEKPCCVLTSMVKGVDVAVFDIIRELAAGEWKGGVRELGLAEGGVGYVYDERNQKWISPEVRDRIEALRQRIVDGQIQVPQK